MSEDKQKIYSLLCKALQATRDQYDLKELEFEKLSEDHQIVTVKYENGGKQVVNVSLDSGIAMIRDILRNIG